ncbi:MAG: transcriptional repressor [Clostridiales bacterium]|nr:transcriptional repressor [Clostridiales bacterium]
MSIKYNTKQKEKIVEFLKERKDKNITVEEMLNYFENIGEKIGKATIYRHLSDLVEQNIIKKYIYENKNCSCYQYMFEENCIQHYHLKCEKCNKIIHLDSIKLDDIYKSLKEEHDFEINNIKTILYGVCKECKE